MKACGAAGPFAKTGAMASGMDGAGIIPVVTLLFVWEVVL